MDSTATLLLRVYTVVEDSGELVIIGNAAFDLYDTSKVLEHRQFLYVWGNMDAMCPVDYVPSRTSGDNGLLRSAS